MDKLVLSRNLETAMKARKLNQSQLDKLSGVDQKTISNMLDPDKDIAPTFRKIQELCNALKIAEWHLLAPYLPASLNVIDKIPEHGYELLTIFSKCNEEQKKDIIKYAIYLLKG